MAWVTSNQVHNTFASLCMQRGDTFTINDDCLEILEEILRKLASEDCTLRTFRRAIGFGQNIRKNLIPLLIYVKDDTKITDAAKIIDTTIKILVNLTIPVEYLLPIDIMSRTDVGKHTIFELSKLLTTSKEAFTDSRSTKAVVDHMKYLVENDSQLSVEQCNSINNCLLLLRNILHIPEDTFLTSNSPLTHSSMQNQIIWNLFTQSIDKVIIYLMSCPQKMYWSVTIVQLIALMYKDQHVGTLQKLLNLWLEASYSESSEDNESNTSPPPDQVSDDSSPIITSDPTSDSSDNGGNDRNEHKVNAAIVRNKCNTTEAIRTTNRNKTLVAMKRNKSTETETSTSSGVSSMGQFAEIKENQQSQNLPGKKINPICPSSQSEISDCGYVTQVENQESISTSSNDDEQPHQKPVHQKPHSFQKNRYNNGKSRATTALEKKELRRKKLVKRSKTNIINMKGLMHHLPTDEDIANILKEFTVDFLLKGYGTLVHDLHAQLLTNIHLHIDTSHFFWLVTYFLKFATQLELDPEHISPVLSCETLSYLIFQGVWLCEELEISYSLPDIDLKPCLRRLHLVVTAIREFLQGIEIYQKIIHLSDSDRDNLVKLQEQIIKMEDLKMLFVLLLRQYNPNLQNKQYLQDLILTNHIFLLFLDNASATQDQHLSMMEHLKQFATVKIMRQYGLLLEKFKENGEFVNNCIFTMMHHIGGDLKNVPTLFQPSILKTFSQIWETDYELCDDWSDLIEYVIHKFINTPGHCTDTSNAPIPNDNLQNVLKENDHSSPSDNDEISEWTKEEKENLLRYYNQSRTSSDTIANITKKYEDSGMRRKTQISIITELLEQNIIDVKEYNNLMKNNKQAVETYDQQTKIHNHFEQMVDENSKTEETLVDSDIKLLKTCLYKENKKTFVDWLQNILIETCYVKLVLNNSEDFKDDSNVMEPTIYYFALLNLPIPIVAWTTEHTNILKYQPFVLLLHKLGFYLPADTGKIFVRIPNFWTADYIFSIAQQLGPINQANFKFDINKLNGMRRCNLSEVESQNSTPIYESGKFSTADLKQTPSVVRYTPLPNSSEWFQNILQTKITSVMDSTLQLPSTNELSIAIPDVDVVTGDFPPPELVIVKTIESDRRDSPVNMECSPIHQLTDIVLSDLERNSICDTASVASDLTRMCVSDEEEKMILIIEKTRKIT